MAGVFVPGSAPVIAGGGVKTAGELTAASELADGRASDVTGGLPTAGLLAMTGASTAGFISIPIIRGVSRSATSIRSFSSRAFG